MLLPACSLVNRNSPISAGLPRNTYTLARNISAIQVLPGNEGSARLGTILQLPEGTQLRICGDGFNERTVKISCEGGHYFVFLEDIKPEPLLRAKMYAGG